MTVMTDLVMPKDLVRAQSLAGGMRSLVAMLGKGLSGRDHRLSGRALL